MFYPTISPKCVIYVRKDLDLHPTIILSFSDSILSLGIDTHLGPIELVNIYAFKPDTFIQQAVTHPSPPLSKCIIMGDFNMHNAWWYSPVAEEANNLIRNSKSRTTPVVNWLDSHTFQLANCPKVPTHFPCNGNSPSILDLSM